MISLFNMLGNRGNTGGLMDLWKDVSTNLLGMSREFSRPFDEKLGIDMDAVAKELGTDQGFSNFVESTVDQGFGLLEKVNPHRYQILSEFFQGDKKPTPEDANALQAAGTGILNFPKSAAEVGGSLYQMGLHPVETGSHLLSAVEGGVVNLLPGNWADSLDDLNIALGLPSHKPSQEMAGEFGQMIARDYGSWEGFKNQVAQNPAQIVLDLMAAGWLAKTGIRSITPAMQASIKESAQKWGSMPVGLSMKDVSGKQLAKTDPAGFYFKSEQTILDMKQPSMAAEQVGPYLKNRGVKQGELEDLGLIEYIESFKKGDKITKEGLLGALEANRFELYHTQLTTDGASSGSQTSVQIDDPYNPSIYDNDPGDVNNVGALTMQSTGDHWKIMEDPSSTSGPDDLRDEIMANMGSHEYYDDSGINQAISSTRELYPFNYGKDYREQESGNIKLIRMLHHANPELFPATSGMVLDEYQIEFDDHINPVTTHPDREAIGKAKRKEFAEKIAHLQDQVKDNRNKGIMEWDQILLETLGDSGRDYVGIAWDDFSKDREQLLPNVSNDMLGQYVRNAADGLGELEYLQDPHYEINVPIPGADVHYTVWGSNTDGWSVAGPTGETWAADFLDLPDAQMAIESDAIDSGFGIFGQDPETLIENYGESGTTKWSGWTQPGSDLATYTEELLRVNTDKGGLTRGSGGMDFTGGHHPDHPNTMTHLRKTVRWGDPVWTKGIDEQYNEAQKASLLKTADQEKALTNPDNIPTTYFLEELQSDWHQQARQYGYTRDETKTLKHNTNKRMLEIGSMRTFFGKLDSNMSKLAIDLRKTHGTFDFGELYDQRTRTYGSLDDDNKFTNFTLTKKQQKQIDKLKNEVDKIPNEDIYNAFVQQLGSFEKVHHFMDNQGLLGEDTMNFARNELKEFKDNWDQNPLNPESPTFEFWNDKDRQTLGTYFKRAQEDIKTFEYGLERHTNMEFNPLKDELWIENGLKFAIGEAINNGITRISWTNSEQQLDKWNKSLSFNHKGKIRMKELFENVYDRLIPKAAEKLARDFGGEIGKMTADFGGFKHEVYYLDITDEMTQKLGSEEMIKEMEIKTAHKFQDPEEGSTDGGLHTNTITTEDRVVGTKPRQSMYSGLPLPIAYGLLGEQDQKQQKWRQGLL